MLYHGTVLAFYITRIFTIKLARCRMETDILVGPRNLIALGVVLSAAFTQPEIRFASVRPFLSLWLRLKLFQASITARLRAPRRQRFWEIDMTKFEP